MSKVKNQHFVPQFYLRYFLNTNFKIKVFDKVTGTSFETNEENISSSKYFYDYLPLDNITNTQTIEKVLSYIEGLVSIEYKQLIHFLSTNQANGVDFKLKKTLSYYIFVQLLRTPKARLDLREYAIEIEKQLIEKGVDIDVIINTKLNVDSFNEKEFQLFSILNIDESTIDDFASRYWIFWKNDTSTPFYTSDNPVIGISHSLQEYEIYFPLTPNFAVSLLIKSQFPYFAESDNKILSITDIDNIIFYNSSIFTRCNRQLYTNGAQFESFVK